jgi:hypothetical protein
MKLLGFMNKSIKEKRYGFPLYGFEERGGSFENHRGKERKESYLIFELGIGF